MVSMHLIRLFVCKNVIHSNFMPFIFIIDGHLVILQCVLGMAVMLVAAGSLHHMGNRL